MAKRKSKSSIDKTREFFPTSPALTRYLIRTLLRTTFIDHSFVEQIPTVIEPCAGAGHIIRVFEEFPDHFQKPIGYDIDPVWDYPIQDALTNTHEANIYVTNPPFSLATEIAQRMLLNADALVAMYHRLSLFEGAAGRDTFWTDYPPNKVLMCPRVAHRRSEKTGRWETDNQTCVWSVWDTSDPRGFTRMYWPDAQVYTELEAEKKAFRADIDAMVERIRRFDLKVAA